jgi:hypothetical protein
MSDLEALAARLGTHSSTPTMREIFDAYVPPKPPKPSGKKKGCSGKKKEEKKPKISKDRSQISEKK